jgi:hypothetical protein
MAGNGAGQESVKGIVEVLLIPNRDLEVLQSFNSRGKITVSAYVRMDTPEHRESAVSEFMQQMQSRLDECGSSPECREALKEDMEIVGLYLKTNGHRDQVGLAIFSCAAELFWRVFPLPVALPSQVSVGPEFDLEPLKRADGQRRSS